MLHDVRPWRPAWKLLTNLSSQLAVTAVSQGIIIPTQLGGTGTRAGYSVRMVNNGTDTVWVCFGTAAVVGTNSIPLLPNTVEVFWVNPGMGQINAIGATGSGSTLIVSYGEGS